MAGWLGEHAPDGGRIGYDPWLHTRAWVEEAKKALAEKGAELVAVDTNPVDAVWPDRPAPSDATLSVQDDAAAGTSSAAKRAEIADWLTERKADAVVLSALDSIAWAFNVRGNDVSHTPVALAYAIVNSDGTADLFVAPEKITDAVRQHLGNAIRVHDRAAFAPALKGFAGKRVAADPERAVAAIFDSLDAGGAKILSLRDPVVLAKALKNPAEIAGHKAAQARDGAALVRFLKWFEETAPGPAHRNVGGGQAARIPRRDRRAQGSELRHHLRHRPQRRDPALQGHRRIEPADRARASSISSIRAANMPTAPPT
jgi:Xaa-Pro aminopeptidase